MRNRLAALVIAVFWLCVAAIPLVIDREIAGFMVKSCMPGSECLGYAMPLIVQIGLVSWGARLLLWPLAAWHLGGAWLWTRLRSNSDGGQKQNA